MRTAASIILISGLPKKSGTRPISIRGNRFDLLCHMKSGRIEYTSEILRSLRHSSKTALLTEIAISAALAGKTTTSTLPRRLYSAPADDAMAAKILAKSQPIGPANLFSLLSFR